MLATTNVDLGDLTDPAGDPYGPLAELRRQGGVVMMPSGLAITTGHAEGLDVLRDPASTSGPISARYHESLPPGAAHDELVHRINFLDPPDHPRVRGIVAKAFTPRRVADIRPFATATADTVAGGLGDRFDVVTDFAHHLPSLVISELLGVPPEDRDRLTTWSDEVTPLLGWHVTDEQRSAALDAAEAFHAYLGDLLDRRAAAPSDDLLTALLEAEEDGQRLHRPELLSLVATLYSAGHRTTRDLTTNGLSHLLTHPDLWARLVADPSLAPRYVSEFLRYEPPTLFIARFPVEDMTAGSSLIPAMTPVIVSIAGANRDPAAYDRPDAFDPDRFAPVGDGSVAPPAPLSFAFGPHYCLGASLARAEAEVMLLTVVSHWPTMRLAPGAAPEFEQRGPFRHLRTLPVEVD